MPPSGRTAPLAESVNRQLPAQPKLSQKSRFALPC
jgi:hypothetical protein